MDLQLDVPQELATSLQLTVYRVLQEALTNAAKHADPPQASVTVRREGAAVLVDVHNPTTPSSPRRLPSGGHGLVGMRERVAAFDGRLHATRSASGFRVRAALPVPGSVALAAEATA